ncbi:hypothetical protein BDV18DRAFT_131354 [Aspergillus unguis]
MGFDDPDLFKKMKSAKDYLYTKTSFTEKYRSPSPSCISPTPLTQPAAENHPQIELSSGGVGKKAEHTPDQEPSFSDNQETEKLTSKAPASTKLSADLHVHNNISLRMAGPQAGALNHSQNKVFAPSSSSSGVRQTRPRPCIPLTPAEAILRAGKVNRTASNTQSKPKSCVPSTVLHPASTTPSIQRAHHLPHKPRTSSPLAERVETASPPPAKTPEVTGNVTSRIGKDSSAGRGIVGTNTQQETHRTQQR